MKADYIIWRLYPLYFILDILIEESWHKLACHICNTAKLIIVNRLYFLCISSTLNEVQIKFKNNKMLTCYMLHLMKFEIIFSLVGSKKVAFKLLCFALFLHIIEGVLTFYGLDKIILRTPSLKVKVSNELLQGRGKKMDK